MMQNRLMMLLAALALLVGLAVVVGVFDRAASTIDVPEIEISADRIQALRIERGGERIVLARDGGSWRLTEPVAAPADSLTVNQLLRELEELELATVVSTNPDRYGQYGVDSLASTVVVQWQGRERRIVVGEQGADFRTVNVRVDEDPRVFATRELITVPADLDRLRNKTVLEIEPSSVRRVEVTSPAGTYALERAGTGWSIVVGDASAPADSAAVARWLGRLAPLKADGFIAEGDPSAVREDATHQVLLEIAGGPPVSLWVRQQEGESNLAASTGGEVVYRFQEYRLSQIVPEESAVRRKDEG